MPWMRWRACMWLKLSLFGLVLCPDWLREDAGVGDRSKEVVEACSHRRWETSLGLSYVCAHGWAETLLVIHLLGRLSPEEIWSAEDSDLKMWGADREMIRSFHSCRSRFNPESVKQKMEGMGCRFLPLGSQEYPSVLADLSEPPAGIFVMGNSEVWSRFLEVPRLTIVGTRGATPYGLRGSQQWSAVALPGTATRPPSYPLRICRPVVPRDPPAPRGILDSPTGGNGTPFPPSSA